MAEENIEKPHVAEAMRGDMEKIVSLCKRRGFIFQSSEIYGGIGGVYDFGPLGAEFKRNLKDEWWKKFVIKRSDVVGLDAGIIMNRKVWQASGHEKGFIDWMVECQKCKHRFRWPDDFPGVEIVEKPKSRLDTGVTKETEEYLCPFCGEKINTIPRAFNTMFRTFIGPLEDDSTVTYLRPETAQGIFVNFKNVLESSRVKIPFGIAQIGKAFRNEITPGNYIFRTREFEQGEIEYFIEADKEESAKWYKIWIDEVKKFYTDLGIKEENLALVEHPKEKLSHYSIGTTDIEYKYPFGQAELAGIAQRTDFDLGEHEKHSGVEMKYFDEASGKKYIPFVVEPSMGFDRAMLAILLDAYEESDGSDGREKGEITLRLNPKLAPVKVAVFPLIKKEKLPEMAKEIVKDLKENNIAVFYDESASIGRRYRRQDEIGTPWCVTVDFDSIKDETVTVRDRDTLKQERIKISELSKYFQEKLR